MESDDDDRVSDVGEEEDTEPAVEKSTNELMRDAVAYYKALPDTDPARVAADELGIDITYLDETVPFGEVCGYYHMRRRYNSQHVFWAIRRVRNDGFNSVADTYFLISDIIVLGENTDDPRYPYVTPPRYPHVATLVKSADLVIAKEDSRLRNIGEMIATYFKDIDDVVKDAKDQEIDISYIDDTAPCGEVCGYDMIVTQHDDTRRTLFLAVRRM
jgi:hypothetical protein